MSNRTTLDLVASPAPSGVFDPAEIVDRLYRDGCGVITFYTTVYAFLDCRYSVFLDQVIPEDQRAPLRESTLRRLAAGNVFEANQIAALVTDLKRNGLPYAEVGVRIVDVPNSWGPEDIRSAVAELGEHFTVSLVVDGLRHDIPARKSELAELLASRQPDSVVFIQGVFDYHDIEDQDTRHAVKSELELATLSAMADGIAAQKAGLPGPVILAPRLPATYVPLLGRNLVGEPDLLVPVAEQCSYTSVDYKDSKALDQSSATRRFLISPATSPFLENAVDSDELGAGVLKKKQRLQLYHYHLMLTEILPHLGAEAVPTAGIIGRDGVCVWSDMETEYWGRRGARKSAAAIYQETVELSLEARELGRAFAEGADVILPAELNPARRTACDECPFRKQCAREREEIKHLSLHPDLADSKAMEIAEVLPAPTLTALAYSDPDTLAESIIDRGVKGFGQSREHVEGKVVHLIDQARTLSVGKAYRRRTRSRIPRLEAVIEVHFDIENNNDAMGDIPPNHWFQTGWVTKKGVSRVDMKENRRYSVRWSDGTPEGEAEMFASFWRSFKRLEAEAATMYDELLERYGPEPLAGVKPFRAFVYSGAEYRVFRAKAREHAGYPGVPTLEELERYFVPSNPERPESATVVDLCAFIKEYLHLPLSDRKLKSVAPYVGHAWADEDPSGLSATLWASDMFTTSDPTERERLRRRLEQYNKDDCYATLAIREWVDKVTFKSVEVLDSGLFTMRFPRRSARRSEVPQPQLFAS